MIINTYIHKYSHAPNRLFGEVSPLHFTSPGQPFVWCVCVFLCVWLGEREQCVRSFVSFYVYQRWLRITFFNCKCVSSCQHPTCVCLFTALVSEHTLTQIFVYTHFFLRAEIILLFQLIPSGQSYRQSFSEYLQLENLSDKEGTSPSILHSFIHSSQP